MNWNENKYLGNFKKEFIFEKIIADCSPKSRNLIFCRDSSKTKILV